MNIIVEDRPGTSRWRGFCRHIPQFPRLQFVQASTINTAFAQHRCWTDPIQELPDLPPQVRSCFQRLLEWCHRVEHQVHVGRRRLGVVQYEAEGLSVFLVASSEICADKRCRWPVFLNVPTLPMPADIAVGYALGLAVLEIRPQFRVALPYPVFPPWGIEQEQPPLQHRIAVAVARNFVIRQIPRTRQDWLKRLHRKPAPVDFVFRQDEVSVVARGQAPLDFEKVAEHRSVGWTVPAL